MNAIALRQIVFSGAAHRGEAALIHINGVVEWRGATLVNDRFCVGGAGYVRSVPNGDIRAYKNRRYGLSLYRAWRALTAEKHFVSV